MGDFVGPCFGGELTKSRLGLSVHKIEAEPLLGALDDVKHGQVAGRAVITP
jgi:hypothetical protein